MLSKSSFNPGDVVLDPFCGCGTAVDAAEKLGRDDPHQFQQWVCWQVGGWPRDKKGGDKGVDGWFPYLDAGGKIATGVISVKAGDIVNPTMVRDMGRVMGRDKHKFGLFVMKMLPTKGMRDEAASQTWYDDTPIGPGGGTVPELMDEFDLAGFQAEAEAIAADLRAALPADWTVECFDHGALARKQADADARKAERRQL